MKYIIRRYYTLEDFQCTNEVKESNLDTREFMETIEEGKTKPKKIEVYKLVSEQFN